MPVKIPHAVRRLGAAILFATVAAEPALASTPVPGPLLGAGAPALALFAVGYYLIRKRRDH
jgi:hypothetical protein